MKTCEHLRQYLAEFFLELEMFQTKLLKEIKTHFMFNASFSTNRAVYEVMGENIVEPETLLMTIERGSCALPAGYERL
jgi:hypothetical protein